MNSLSILSSRVNKVIGNTPPSTPHSESFRDSTLSNDLHRGAFQRHPSAESHFTGQALETDDEEEEEEADGAARLQCGNRAPISVGERIYLAFLSPWVGAVRWILSTIAASTNWVLSSVYNDEGVFSPLIPLQRTIELFFRPFSKGDARGVQISLPQIPPGSAVVPDSVPLTTINQASHNRARSFSVAESKQSAVEEISARRSIRIRLYNEETHQKTKASSVKSPTSPSPSLRLTKYPRIAGPPVPLLSRKTSPKTLILDLDETLIHSLAKGGRMSSGHMVEVKLDRQHAILYYVHKRPYCDEFLRKVMSAS
jgi:CTD nuclear envelope phosphatase 1